MVFYVVADVFIKKEKAVNGLLGEINLHSKNLIKLSEELKEMEKAYEVQKKQLDVTNKKIKDLTSEKMDLDNIVKKLNVELRKEKAILENMSVIDEIVIGSDSDKCYNMMNGLLDLNRDILMKLLRLMKDKKKTRNILGMTEKTYLWMKQLIFRWVQILNEYKLSYPSKEDRYEGSVCEGVPHGRGTCLYSNGMFYDGDWRKGKKCGKGMLTWGNGERYFGEFYNDMREGNGVYIHSAGYVYSGQWKENKKWGKGLLTSSDRSMVVGDYVNDVFEGNGVEIGKDGHIYEREWKGSERCGKGKFTWLSGETYLGEWVNGVREGCGFMKYADGGMYDGQWKADKKEGRGSYISRSGERDVGDYENDKKVKDVK